MLYADEALLQTDRNTEPLDERRPRHRLPRLRLRTIPRSAVAPLSGPRPPPHPRSLHLPARPRPHPLFTVLFLIHPLFVPSPRLCPCRRHRPRAVRPRSCRVGLAENVLETVFCVSNPPLCPLSVVFALTPPRPRVRLYLESLNIDLSLLAPGQTQTQTQIAIAHLLKWCTPLSDPPHGCRRVSSTHPPSNGGSWSGGCTEGNESGVGTYEREPGYLTVANVRMNRGWEGTSTSLEARPEIPAGRSAGRRWESTSVSVTKPPEVGPGMGTREKPSTTAAKEGGWAARMLVGLHALVFSFLSPSCFFSCSLHDYVVSVSVRSPARFLGRARAQLLCPVHLQRLFKSAYGHVCACIKPSRRPHIPITFTFAPPPLCSSLFYQPTPTNPAPTHEQVQEAVLHALVKDTLDLAGVSERPLPPVLFTSTSMHGGPGTTRIRSSCTHGGDYAGTPLGVVLVLPKVRVMEVQDFVPRHFS